MFTSHALYVSHRSGAGSAESGGIALVRGPGATLVVGVAVEPNEREAMEEAHRIARDAATLLNGGVADAEWRAFVEAHALALSARQLGADDGREREAFEGARAAVLARLASVPRSG